jgi:hypothetical protein
VSDIFALAITVPDKSDLIPCVPNSEKMYKGRFKAWDLRKGRVRRGEDPKRRPASERSGASGMNVVHVTHSGFVGPIKVQRSSTRAKLVGQAKSTTSGTGDQIYLPGISSFAWSDKSPTRTPSPLLSHVIAPESLRMPEDCVRAILDYTTSRFETGMWKFTDEDVETEEVDVCDWSAKAIVATETIQRGDTKAGFRMVQICLQQYRSLVLSGHPLLFHKSLSVMFYLLLVGSDLAASFVRYSASLCSITLGERHPLTRLWSVLRSVDLARIRQYANVILEAQCDIFLDQFGPRNKYVAVVRLETARLCHKFGVMSASAATGLIEKIREFIASDVQHWTMNYVLWAHIELAYTYVDGSNYAEAEAILQYIGDCLHADGLDIWTKSHYYMLRAKVMDNLGSRDKATELRKERVEVCLEDVGPEHQQTVRALGDLERHYRNGGDVEAADKLRLEFEAKWDTVCKREALPET